MKLVHFHGGGWGSSVVTSDQLFLKYDRDNTSSNTNDYTANAYIDRYLLPIVFITTITEYTGFCRLYARYGGRNAATVLNQPECVIPIEWVISELLGIARIATKLGISINLYIGGCVIGVVDGILGIRLVDWSGFNSDRELAPFCNRFGVLLATFSKRRSVPPGERFHERSARYLPKTAALWYAALGDTVRNEKTTFQPIMDCFVDELRAHRVQSVLAALSDLYVTSRFLLPPLIQIIANMVVSEPSWDATEEYLLDARYSL